MRARRLLDASRAAHLAGHVNASLDHVEAVLRLAAEPLGMRQPLDHVAELAKGADLLVTPTSSFNERMELLTQTGRWQAMTPDKQAQVLAQAKRNITMEDIGKMATRANVKVVVLSHSNLGAGNPERWEAELAKDEGVIAGEIYKVRGN